MLRGLLFGILVKIDSEAWTENDTSRKQIRNSFFIFPNDMGKLDLGSIIEDESRWVDLGLSLQIEDTNRCFKIHAELQCRGKSPRTQISSTFRRI